MQNEERAKVLKKMVVVGLLVVGLCAGAPRAGAQQKAADAEGHPWWQHAVFYEIYPRSFADSNNDGIGDLNGITSKLDYLKDLGVDAIWVTPCFPSPQVDFGYDVSDYEAIDPMYGTMNDFDRMVSEGKKRNVRVILDFVVRFVEGPRVPTVVVAIDWTVLIGHSNVPDDLCPCGINSDNLRRAMKRTFCLIEVDRGCHVRGDGGGLVSRFSNRVYLDGKRHRNTHPV